MNKLYAILFLTLLLCNNIYGQRWISGQGTDISNGEPDVSLIEEPVLLDEFTIIDFFILRERERRFSTNIEIIHNKQRIRNFRIQRETLSRQTTNTITGTPRIEYVSVNTRRAIRNFRIERETISREIISATGPTTDELTEFSRQQHQERQRQIQSIVQRQFAGEGLQIPSLSTFIINNIRYPIIAIENNIQGRILVQFSIERDRSVSNVEIIRSVDPVLDREARRVIQAMPRLSYDEMKRYVCSTPSRFILPVNFRLISAEELDNLRTNQQITN